jgi:hypothetical protein
MAADSTQWREPEVFASGDSLIFSKYLPAYLPGDGWHVHYVVTQSQPNGAKEVASFDSTQSTTDPTVHTVNVANFGAGLDAGEYVLSGQVVNSAGNAPLNIAAGEKHTIYYAELELDPDLADNLASVPIATFVQTMIPILESKIQRLESYDLTETDVQRTRFIVEDKNKTYERYWRLLEFRNYEKKQERAANTGMDQNYVRPVYAGGW